MNVFGMPISFILCMRLGRSPKHGLTIIIMEDLKELTTSRVAQLINEPLIKQWKNNKKRNMKLKEQTAFHQYKDIKMPSKKALLWVTQYLESNSKKL